MSKRTVVIIIACLIGVNLYAQNKLVKGHKALTIYNYFEARRIFKDELKKNKVTFFADTTIKSKPYKAPQNLSSAAFGLGTIYSRTDNPFSNLDTAYLYARLADSLFTLSTPEQQLKLKEKLLPPDSVAIDTLFGKIYTRGYKEASLLNTIAAYDSYINRFPQSSYVGVARQKIEDIDWNNTQNDDSYQAYKTFVNKYPYSDRVSKAKGKYELRLFQTLTKANNVSVYRNFVDNFPDSPYALQAQDSVYSLSTKSSQVKDFYNFIKQNPNNRNIDKAWDRLYIVYNADGLETTLKRFKEEYPDYPGADRLGRDLQLAGAFLLPFEQNGKWGYIDTTGKTVITPQYEWAEVFSDGLGAVGMNGKTAYINKAAQTVIKADFDEGYAFTGNYTVVKQGDKYGIIDRIGKVIVSFEYDDISAFSEGLAVVSKGDLEGYVNTQGTLVMPIVFEEASDFSNGLAVVKKDGKYGFINTKGGYVISPDYDWAENFKDGIARAKKNNLTGIINTEGTVLADFKYSLVSSFTDGLAIVTLDGAMGFINTKGVEVIKPQYNFAMPFSYNVMVGDTIAKVEWKKKRGFIYKNDKSVYQFKFDDVNTPAEGMMAAKQKGKWGFVDKAGKNIIPFKFDNAGTFKNGMALASSKGNTGLIDRNGKWIVEPKYDDIFDNYVENVLVVRVGEKYGLINKKGGEILPVQYDEPEKVTGDIYMLTNGEKIAYYNMATGKFIWQQQ